MGYCYDHIDRCDLGKPTLLQVSYLATDFFGNEAIRRDKIHNPEGHEIKFAIRKLDKLRDIRILFEDDSTWILTPGKDDCNPFTIISPDNVQHKYVGATKSELAYVLAR